MPGSSTSGRRSIAARSSPGSVSVHDPTRVIRPCASTSIRPSAWYREPPDVRGVRMRARMENGGPAGRDVTIG